MKHLLVFCALLMLAALPAAAQDYAWCGYALVEGLSPTETDLAVLAVEAITPAVNPSFSQPDELLQTRYSLNGTKVILEGCFRVEPARSLVIALLDNITPLDLQTLDAQLVYTIFAPGGSRDMSQAAVLDYLTAHLSEWELPTS